MSAMPGMGVLDAAPFSRAARQPVAGTHHTVGPNAIIQTRAALDEMAGSDVRRTVFERSGYGRYSDNDPDAMVGAHIVNAINYEIGAVLPARTASAVMRRAGALTADYILANRIPKPAQTLLKMLPRPLAQRLLIKAIAKNAWTFAGQAKIETGADFIAIHDNPICLGKVGFSACLWHAAVFERLFRTLVDPAITIAETECGGRGGKACRFEIGHV